MKTSLDDLGAFLVQKLMATVRAEKLDFLVPELLVVAIKFAIALGASHPKDFRHGSSSCQPLTASSAPQDRVRREFIDHDSPFSRRPLRLRG
jgi:hypothetical protein